MNHALSTHLFVNHRLTTALLGRIQEAGIPAVEIFCARQHLDYRDKAQIAELGHWFRDCEMKLHSLHAPMYNDEIWGKSGPHAVVTIAETVKARRMESVDEIKRAIEIAEQIPFKYLVQHIGVGGEDFNEKKLDAAMTCVEHLKAFAKPLGVTVLLENIPNELSTPERLLEFLNITHFTDVGICFDFGHAHMMSNVAEAFESLKPHIRSTHVHDNKGDADVHLWPGDGTINWGEAMQLLRTAPQVPPLLMEIDGEGKKDIPSGMSAAYRRLEEAGQAVQA